jgi:N-acetylglucosaminyl-diphospho-decaprenol L-rhamnosyltransferase
MSASSCLTGGGESESVMKRTVGVVTVTHNDEKFMTEYLDALQAQTHSPDKVILADSGSDHPELLAAKVKQYALPIERVYAGKEVGFCVGTNFGWRMVRDLDYVLFLNPDAFLAPDFLERAVAYMENEPTVGMVTPSLVRYDIEAHRPLDMIDTTGVVRNWFGNFVERDCGLPEAALQRYHVPNDIPWLCAAAVFARREAIEDVVEHCDQVFDESFYMYKDDTDLSWRVRRAGWRLVHHPELRGYHCRGWKKRSTFSRKLRLMSARNEVTTCIKNHSPYVVLSMAKYLAVRILNL